MPNVFLADAEKGHEYECARADMQHAKSEVDAERTEELIEKIAHTSLNECEDRGGHPLSDWFPAELHCQSARADHDEATRPTASVGMGDVEEWPRLEANVPLPIAPRVSVRAKQMVNTWLGHATTLDAVHTTRGEHAGAVVCSSVRRGGVRTTVRRDAPGRCHSGLKSALKVQSLAVHAAQAYLAALGEGALSQAVSAAKLRGETRRRIGKKSRSDVFQRARRSAPVDRCDEQEVAARRGRHALQDENLATLLSDGLSLRARSARELCVSMAPDCMETTRGL